VRVLLIDDTPEIAELLTFALRDRGHDVAAAGYSGAIIELIDQHRAEALVLDCSVLEMSASLFDAVRESPQHAELPVIIISDRPEEADRRLRSRRARRVLLVPKPFTGAHVAHALDELRATGGGEEGETA
jgi:two-component system OmpR family response regulator